MPAYIPVDERINFQTGPSGVLKQKLNVTFLRMSGTMNIKPFIVTLILGLLSVTVMQAQDREKHELHSMMIYNFLKYIQWPESTNSGQFVIGVMGDDEVYNTLNSWYGDKERQGKVLRVKKIASAAEASQCQLVYIGRTSSSMFDAVQQSVQSNPTLIITDKNGLGEKGSGINFKIVNNRLKFELNQGALNASKLKVSSQLAAMAIVI